MTRGRLQGGCSVCTQLPIWVRATGALLEAKLKMYQGLDIGTLQLTRGSKLEEGPD